MIVIQGSVILTKKGGAWGLLVMGDEPFTTELYKERVQ